MERMTKAEQDMHETRADLYVALDRLAEVGTHEQLCRVREPLQTYLRTALMRHREYKRAMAAVHLSNARHNLRLRMRPQDRAATAQ